MNFPISKISTLIAVVSVSALALLASAGPRKGQVSSIRLERTPCYGTCPVYSFTLYPDDSIKYLGKSYTPRIGQFGAKTFKGTFNRLAGLIDKLGYYKLKADYSVLATDQPSTNVTVVRDGKSYLVHQYGHKAPDELWAVQKLIDATLDEVYEWTPVKQ